MLQAAQRLGDFEIIRLLGKGGMGEVYEALQLHPERPVALKVLAPWLAQNEEALKRFWREAAVPARLDHAGIARIISTGQTEDGVAYYTMQLIRGLSLAELVRLAAVPSTVAASTPDLRQGGETPGGAPVASLVPYVPEAEVASPAIEEYLADRFRFTARVGMQAARALAHAHQQGYLHRDIKPSNLMIDRQGQVILVDFGLTKALDAGADASRTGALRGTPWYMSPEQARGEPIDQRSDIYSLGVTLYELATAGSGPFTASRDNADEVLAQVRAGIQLPLRMLAPNIPRELAQIIERAIQFKPRRRYQNAAELAADLEQVLGTPALPAAPQPRLSKKALRRLLFAGCLAVVVTALGVIAWKYIGVESGSQHVGQQQPKPPDRERRWGVPIALLTIDHEPVFPRKLFGDGAYYKLPFELALRSGAEDKPTLIALDDDPERRWYEFSIDFRPTVRSPRSVESHFLGIFFGYRESEAAAGHAPFFVVQLIEPELKIGTALLDEADRAKGRGVVHHWLQPLPFADKDLLLPELKPDAKSWRRLQVRAVPGEISVTVDAASWSFSTDKYRAEVAKLKADVRRALPAPPDPRGALGIWVKHGTGSFKNATITPLPAEGERK